MVWEGAGRGEEGGLRLVLMEEEEGKGRSVGGGCIAKDASVSRLILSK